MAWQDDVTALSALYLMLERGQRFTMVPVTEADKRAAGVLNQMWVRKLIEEDGEFWAVTDKGRESLKAAIAAQDILRQMEVFAHVDPTRILTAEEADASAPDQVRPEVWDPRFALDNQNSFDMRLAVIEWLAEFVPEKKLEPRTLIFLQQLGAAAFSVPLFWANPAAKFAEIDAIVVSAYQWQHMAPDDLVLAKKRMATMYGAGQIEQQKREGATCGECGVPLVMFEKRAAESELLLTGCPCCPHVFSPPPDPAVETSGVLACPRCKAPIWESDRICCGCGALVDFSLPAGSVQTDTTETITTETVWSNDYGYVSYGWLDPWDPYLNVVAIGALFYDPWMVF